MSFQEKSAYVMVIALFLGGGHYFYEVLSQSVGLNGMISLVIPGLIKLTFMLVIVSVIGHIIIAGLIVSQLTEYMIRILLYRTTL